MLKFPCIVLSRTQTNGYGRFKRQWESPDDSGIYVSYGFEVKGLVPELTSLNLVIPYLITEILQSYNPRKEIKIKYPNDIFVENSKLGGILTENLILKNKTILIIGIGINIKKFHVRDRSVISLDEIFNEISIDRVIQTLSEKILFAMNRISNIKSIIKKEDICKYLTAIDEMCNIELTDGTKVVDKIIDIDIENLSVVTAKGKYRFNRIVRIFV